MATFSVIRTSEALVKPSIRTPLETLELSAIDRIPVLRCNTQTLHVFRHGPGAARVIREALSRVLVPYYPLAGRLKGSLSGQLQIECCEGGVRFVEATAGSSLVEVGYFEDIESIPYQELLPDQYNDPDGREPLVQMQVTQFKCKGFVIGLIFCHTICDGLGAAQFMNALGEIARGVDSPSVEPVWHRHFFESPEYSSSIPSTFPLPPPPTMPNYYLDHANIDISLDRIAVLKRAFQETTGQNCSTFDVMAASFWSCRTCGVKFDPRTELKLVFFANCRGITDPPLPKGFYGNCFFPVTVTASSDWLEQAPFTDVVRLIQLAKSKLPNEFARYKDSLHVPEGGRDPFITPLAYTTLFMSEWGRLGFNRVDYGWGPPVHIVPIQGSIMAPVGIVGSSPLPKRGIRLTTWCVEETHKQGFLDEMAKILSTS